VGSPNAEGSITYINCPDTWGKVTDSTSYIFRDDFMGATLDTATDWTRSQSTAGNIEINTAFNWLSIQGNGNWGDNGIFSQTTTARSAGKVFECWVYIADTGDVTHNNVVVGWHDGAGQSYSDFAHGLDFTNSGGVLQLKVFENGNDRGEVGTDYTRGHIYRVRITLGASNDATYEIQGGPEYEPLGSASWDDITPGTTSSATSPLAIGVTVNGANTSDHYIGDMKMY
jgi:hypothetical protein